MSAELCPSCTLVQAGSKEEDGDKSHQCVYRTKLAVLAKRFRLLQKTLEQQQLVIEKQQRRLEQRRSREKLEARHEIVSKPNHTPRTQDRTVELDAPSRDDTNFTHGVVAEGDQDDRKKPIDSLSHASIQDPPTPPSFVRRNHVPKYPREVDDGFISARRPSDDSTNHTGKAATLKRSSMHVASLASCAPTASSDPDDPTNLAHKRTKHNYHNVPAFKPSTSTDASLPAVKTSHVLSHVPPYRATTTTTSAANCRRSNPEDGPSNDPPAFKYIEVVRKRDARMALPGHACEECAQYYAALGDEFEGQQFACSRHRAKWEPYATPEDFWRLSFPDSPS